MVKILRNSTEVAEINSYCRKNDLTRGFVPTMGALHPGHLSLIKVCKKINDICLVSIFINPTQFNDSDDFNKYPRTLQRDIELLETTDCDYVFVPEVKELYPHGIRERIIIDLGELGSVLEARHRPGHFDGVVTVVKKLFDIIEPDAAFFGQKDYQQCLVIKKMTEYFKLTVNIIICPIVREADGLAMSSRNTLLNTQERNLAPLIYKTLTEACLKLENQPPEEVMVWAKDVFMKQPLIRFEYFDICDASSLRPINILEEANKAVICTALKIGSIRLIDNIMVN